MADERSSPDGPLSTDAEHPSFRSGVNTELSMTAQTEQPRTESGIGALMPWADSLWAITYPAHGPSTGTGTGLYEIEESLSIEKRPESVVSTSANRMIHTGSDQLIIGPYAIDTDGEVRVFEGLLESGLDGRRPRLTATMEHLEDPENAVYFLSMEGGLYEGNVETLETELLVDLTEELGLESGPGSAHFKGGHTGQNRVVVTNNTYDEAEFTGERSDGRLAEWDGESWTILETKPGMEVAGRGNFGEVIFATGWDERSAILFVLSSGEWQRYRLPKSSHTYDHMWQTEWTRIREVETERYLMDCHGTFFELSPLAYDDSIWGVNPISTHLRVIPDFCSFRGQLVMAGNQTTPISDNNVVVGQPQSGLWVGKTDDIWEFGKPKGWGGPWRDDEVLAGDPSDPYLMTGYDEKVLHLSQESDQPVEFRVEVDFLGNGRWNCYETISVDANGYEHHEFPSGFSAHWVRLVSDTDCEATAYFTYS